MISTAPPSPSPGGLQDAPGFRVSGSPFPRVPGQTESYRNAAPKPPRVKFSGPGRQRKGACTPAAQSGGKAARNCMPVFLPRYVPDAGGRLRPGTFCRQPTAPMGPAARQSSPPGRRGPLTFLKTRTGKKQTTGTGSCRLPGQHFQAGSFIRPFLYFSTLAAHYNPAAIPGSFRKRDAGGCCSCVRRHHRNAA